MDDGKEGAYSAEYTVRADWIHMDVMDGNFVPNITMGSLVVKAIRPVTRLPLDVHLMIADPEKFVAPFIEAGADIITFHHLPFYILFSPRYYSRHLTPTVSQPTKKYNIIV